MVVGDIIASIDGAVKLIRVIDESFGFYKECRDLKARCEVVKSIIDDNKDGFVRNNTKGLDGLKAVIEQACSYLGNKKTGWLYRNPFVEKVFFLRIEKFEKKLDSWIVTLTLSISVRRAAFLFLLTSLIE